MIVAQVRAVAEDIGVDAVKVGMLGDEPTIDAVVEALDLVGDAPVVVDPVMVSASGATLLDRNAKAALIERVLPLRHGGHARTSPRRASSPGSASSASPEELARAIQALGPEAVIVTGRPLGATAPTCSSTAPGRSGSRARGTRTGPRTDRDARTHRPSRPSSRGAPSSAEAARWAREIAAEAVGNGLGSSAGRRPGRRARARRAGGARPLA